MNVLALDPSASCTGWALMCDDTIAQAGYSPPFEGATDGERYAMAYAWLDNLMLNFLKKDIQIDLVLMEGYFFSKRFATGTSVGVELRGVFKLLLHGLGVRCQIVDPAEWKRAILKRATPRILKDLDYPRLKSDKSKMARWKKELKKRYGKEKAKKMLVVVALQKLFGLDFPKKILNRATNRKINFKFDVSDAIGILVGYFMKKGPTLFKFDIQWDFEVLDD